MRWVNREAMLFTQMVKVVEDQNKALHDEWLNTAMEHKNQWERELERRKRFGIVAPDPLPHPDQIHIGMNTRQVLILGPMTKEGLPKWEHFRERKAECDREIARNQQDLERPRMRKYRKFLLEDLAHEQKLRAIICRAIPD